MRLHAPFYIVENWTVETVDLTMVIVVRVILSREYPAVVGVRGGRGSCKWGLEALLRANFRFVACLGSVYGL